MSETLRPANVTDIGELPLPHSFELTSFQQISAGMEWQGTAQEALVEIARETTYSTPGMPIARSFWHLPRLIKVAVDSEVIGTDRLELVSEVTRFALQVYATGSDTEGLTKVTGMFAAHGLLDSPVAQKKDHATLFASTVQRSLDAAERLTEKVKEPEFNRPLLILPVCHGGVAAGLSVALKTGEFRNNRDIQVYPIRYSRAKSKDLRPKISNAEIGLIATSLEDRTVVVSDEDACTGRTIQGIIRLLQWHLPADSPIIGIANDDSRGGSTAKATQGVWWERL